MRERGKSAAVAGEPTPNPAPRRGLSLKVKLSLVIIALVFLTVSLVSAFLIQQEQQTLTAEMTKRGLTIAENLAAGAKSSLLASDELTLNVLVKDAMKDPDVAYVAIVDENSTVLAHSDVGEIGKPIVRPEGFEKLGTEPQIRTYKTKPRGEVIDFAMPLVFSETPVGALYLGFTKQAITDALALAFRRAVVITGAMVVVGVLGAIGLSHLLSRPIFRLVRGTRAIAEGDFNVVLPITSGDELGVLTDSFNQMARSLREKEMIKHAFTRYVAREVVEEILKDPEHLVLTGERREATVLFCDIRGFTPMSERLSPEDVVSAPQRVLHAHDRDRVQARRHPRQVPGRRRHGRVRRAHRAPRSRRARGAYRHRHAAGHHRPQRGARPREQGAHPGRHRRERGRGGGRHGGLGRAHGVHGDRRQRQPRLPARGQRQAGPASSSVGAPTTRCATSSRWSRWGRSR